MTSCYPKRTVRVQARPISAISNELPSLARRSANFQPSIWGDHFLADASDDIKENNSNQEKQKHQLLKEVVEKILSETPNKTPQILELIDAIQRLGVAYHFEREIEASLRNIYNSFDEFNDEDDNDLHVVALRFRLLRQHGHYVPCDVFNKFKNLEGGFKESLVKNVRGILSLYEAANFRVHGEDILEEALIFTTNHLKSLTPNLCDYSLAAQINQALEYPIQKTLTRPGARQFISLYQEDQFHNQHLLNFAKMDFNLLQKEHRKELRDLTEWWKSLDCEKNFPFARDRIVECYFWALGVYFEPHYSFARRILTKMITMVSVCDDIYDVYGTLDELFLFTDAIRRWHVSALDELPHCLRHYYQALLDVYSEMEGKVGKDGKSDRVQYAIAEMKKLARACFIEAKWFYDGYVPTMEEYMKTAVFTAGYMILATISLVGMGDSVNKEAFDWVTNEPLMLRASSTIIRLSDDMFSHEFEQKRGHVASSIECYMNEHGASKQEAIDEFQKQVTNAWKDINKEYLGQTLVPMPVLERVLNLSRVTNLLYKGEDGYTHSTTRIKDLITLVLVDPVTL